MENFDLITLSRFRTPKIQDHVAVIGKLTRVMNLRIVKKNDKTCKYEYTSCFECGVDIIPLANGGHIIITTLGFYAFSFVEFIERFLEYQRNRIKEQASTLRYFGRTTTVSGIGFIFSDDTDALSTSSVDEDGDTVYEDVEPVYVENEALLEGIKCYDSTDQFVEALNESHQE